MNSKSVWSKSLKARCLKACRANAGQDLGRISLSIARLHPHHRRKNTLTPYLHALPKKPQQFLNMQVIAEPSPGRVLTLEIDNPEAYRCRAKRHQLSTFLTYNHPYTIHPQPHKLHSLSTTLPPSQPPIPPTSRPSHQPPPSTLSPPIQYTLPTPTILPIPSTQKTP